MRETTTWWTSMFGRGRFIGAHIPTLEWLGNFPAAVLLEELIYRFDCAGRQPFTFPDDQLAGHLYLSVSALKEARKQLVERGAVTTERAGMPAKLHYYINLEAVQSQLVSEIQLTSSGDPANSSIYNQTLSDNPAGAASSKASEPEPKAPKQRRARPAATGPDPRVSELMAWYAEQQGYPVAAYARQARAVKWMLDNGYEPAQVQAVYSGLAADDWWREHVPEVTMEHVQKRIGAEVRKNGHGRQAEPADASRAEQLAALRARTAPAPVELDPPARRATIDCPACGGRHYYLACPLGQQKAVANG